MKQVLFCPFCGSKNLSHKVPNMQTCRDCRTRFMIGYFRQLRAKPTKRIRLRDDSPK